MFAPTLNDKLPGSSRILSPVSVVVWHAAEIVPANRKWSRNLILIEAVLAKLKEMAPRYPKPKFDPKTIVIE